MNSGLYRLRDKIRWAFLLLLVAGYILTYARFSDVAGSYVLYTLIAISSSALLLGQLNSFSRQFSAVWLGFVIFIVVYFVRFYWIVLEPLSVRIMLPTPVYYKMVQDSALFKSFTLSVISFSAFSISAAILLYLFRNGKDTELTNELSDSNLHWLVAKGLLIVLPPLMIVLGVIAYTYNIGQMGVDSGEPLPYRLKGVVFYARFTMIPLMIILAVYLSGRSGHAIATRLGVTLLLVHGLTDMLLRGSRSSLLLVILLLFFLVISGGLKLHRNEKILAFFVAILGLFMVPVMTDFRMQRVTEHLAIMDAMSASLFKIGSEGWATLLAGIEFVFFRITGIEAVAAISGMDGEPLGRHAIDIVRSKQGIAGYLTHELYNIPITAHHLSAPGFVGWFYLVGGIPAITIGSVVFATLCVVGWRLLDNRVLIGNVVARTFFLWMLFHALTEGTLDSMGYMLAVGVVSILGLEILMRLVRRAVYGLN